MAIRNVPPATSYNAPGTATGRRSFAAVYEQARRAAANDDQDSIDATAQSNADASNDQNRKYIENLHDRVDSLRGEIIVRVIQAGETDAPASTGDISRLSTRLDTLRQKLQTERTRLSGKLVDVKA